jgi:predicted peptidase
MRLAPIFPTFPLVASFVVLALVLSPARGQTPEVVKAFDARTFDGPGGTKLPYRIYTPPPKPGQTYPLVILLHGSGERGDDNQLQLKHAAGDLLKYAQAHPAIVVVPQCPKGVWWSGPENEVGQPKSPPPAVLPIEAVSALLDQLLKDLPVDRSRVYLTGLSMGGNGAFDFVARRPGVFAAAMPICGWGDAATAAAFKGTAVRVYHGDRDDAVPVDESRKMVAALKAAGVSVEYTEYPGVGHNSWTRTYADPKVLDWLWAQKR